jgi:aspartyl-tRNA(Asn)/glutamyl-tRNA(Gln) amidotransferase subunit C
MQISEETIDHIAHLAKLRFEGEAKLAIRQDLDKIINFMGKLSEIPTDDVEPLIFMSDEVNVLRDDEVEVTLNQAQALKNAPKKDSDYFRIPKVLDK